MGSVGHVLAMCDNESQKWTEWTWTTADGHTNAPTYMVCCNDESRLLLASSRMSRDGLEDNGSQRRWFFRRGLMAHRRCFWMMLANLVSMLNGPLVCHGHGYHQILFDGSIHMALVSNRNHPLALHHHHPDSPLSDLTYDCQNFAFLLGVSFLPIISKCCLNILAALFYLFVRCRWINYRKLLKSRLNSLNSMVSHRPNENVIRCGGV